MEVEFIGKPNLERFVVLFLKLEAEQYGAQAIIGRADK